MILEDDESDASNLEAAAVSVSFDAGADSAFKPSQPTNPSGYEPKNHDETDDDLPSFKELFQTIPPPNASTKASKAEHTLQHLKQPAPDTAGTLADQTKSASGERQGDSLGR